MDNPKYVLYISLKDDEGKIANHPLRAFGLEAEANWYLSGYVDAVANHTGETDLFKIQKLFTINKLGEEETTKLFNPYDSIDKKEKAN